MEAIATRKTLISVGIVMTVNQDFALNPHFTRLYQQGDYDSREIKLTDFANIYSANFPLSNDPRKNFINYLSSIEDREKREEAKAIGIMMDKEYPYLFIRFFSGNKNLIKEAIQEIEDGITVSEKGEWYIIKG